MAQIVCLFQARDRPLRAQHIHYFRDGRPILRRVVRLTLKTRSQGPHLHATHSMTQRGHKSRKFNSCRSILSM